MTIERVFIIGGTGNIGKVLVDELISKKVALTLFVRSPEKVASLLSSGDFNVLQDDLSDLTPLKDALKGHARIFILVNNSASMVQTKATLAQYAYASGVKQIVDVSSITVSMPWRTNVFGDMHRRAEESILAIPVDSCKTCFHLIAFYLTTLFASLFWLDLPE